jgi:hypothetical protein
MKLTLFGLAIFALVACNDGTGSDSADSTNAQSDTTNLNLTPGTEDPNSNMADTMKMKDSIRVKDTIVKDKTAVKQ